MFTNPVKSGEGLFAVVWRFNFVHWLAWREWKHEVFSANFFPDVLTVPFMWPPTETVGANAFSEWLREMRQNTERGALRRMRVGRALPEVPTDPAPWWPWPPEMRDAIAAEERERRDVLGPNFPGDTVYVWKPRFGATIVVPLQRAA